MISTIHLLISFGSTLLVLTMIQMPFVIIQLELDLVANVTLTVTTISVGDMMLLV